jgi:hypothetical protein
MQVSVMAQQCIKFTGRGGNARAGEDANDEQNKANESGHGENSGQCLVSSPL